MQGSKQTWRAVRAALLTAALVACGGSTGPGEGPALVLKIDPAVSGPFAIAYKVAGQYLSDDGSEQFFSATCIEDLSQQQQRIFRCPLETDITAGPGELAVILGEQRYCDFNAPCVWPVMYTNTEAVLPSTQSVAMEVVAGIPLGEVAPKCTPDQDLFLHFEEPESGIQFYMVWVGIPYEGHFLEPDGCALWDVNDCLLPLDAVWEVVVESDQVELGRGTWYYGDPIPNCIEE